MKDNRLGAIALILGAVSGIITLSFHPSSAHRIDLSQMETLILVIIGVHALAIAGLPFSFLGALTLTREIDSPLRLALLALVVYSFSLVATMGAATMSGLVTPYILRQMAAANAAGEQWHTLMGYNHAINQGFAQIGTIGTSVALIVWSIVMLKRGTLPLLLGSYGLIVGLTVIVALASGALSLEVHGTRLVIFAQAAWFIVAGVLLAQAKINPPAAPSLDWESHNE